MSHTLTKFPMSDILQTTPSVNFAMNFFLPSSNLIIILEDFFFNLFWAILFFATKTQLNTLYQSILPSYLLSLKWA